MNDILTSAASVMNFSLGEKVIVQSALERNGVFRERCDLVSSPSEKGLILTDGTFLYPLGQAEGKEMDAVSSHGILGTRTAVAALVQGKKEPRDRVIMDKDFSFLRSVPPDLPQLSAGISVATITDESDLQSLGRLRTQFLAEESGSELSDVEAHSGNIPDLQSVVLKKDGKAIGMINSDFFSKESAMISMLFIEKQHRGHGYGVLLLQQYVRLLLQRSASVCLFYSPTNTSAKKLYERMGFMKEEDWMMVLPH